MVESAQPKGQTTFLLCCCVHLGSS